MFATLSLIKITHLDFWFVMPKWKYKVLYNSSFSINSLSYKTMRKMFAKKINVKNYAKLNKII